MAVHQARVHAIHRRDSSCGPQGSVVLGVLPQQVDPRGDARSRRQAAHILGAKWRKLGVFLQEFRIAPGIGVPIGERVALAWCMDQGCRRIDTNPVRGQAMRT